MNDKNKLATGQVMIDHDAGMITFTDQRFYKTPDGGYVPSVTTILNAYPKDPQFYEWLKKNGENADDIRDEAAFNGSIIHQLCDRYNKGETVDLLDPDGSIRYSTKQWNYFEKYVEFVQRFKPEILMNEFNIINADLGFAGTIDILCNLEGKKMMIDIKTGTAVHKTHFLQLAAYSKLYEAAFGEKVDGYAVLWLNAKTRTEGKKGAIQGAGWQLVLPDNTDEHYWKLFQYTQALYLEENIDAKPKNLTYKLSHSVNKG